MTLHGLLLWADGNFKWGCKKKKKKLGSWAKRKVKVLTLISSQEAAVVVKKFVCSWLFSDWCFKHLERTEQQFQTWFWQKCQTLQWDKMSWSHGKGLETKERKTIKYSTEYNLYRSKRRKTVTQNNMIVMLPSSEFIWKNILSGQTIDTTKTTMCAGGQSIPPPSLQQEFRVFL